MSHTMGYNAREDSCAFGGIEIKTIFLFFRQARFLRRREALSIPAAPEGYPKRSAEPRFVRRALELQGRD